MNATLLVIGRVNEEALKEARLRAAIRAGIKDASTLTVVRMTSEEFLLDVLIFRDKGVVASNETIDTLFGGIDVSGILIGVVMDEPTLRNWSAATNTSYTLLTTTSGRSHTATLPFWVAGPSGGIVAVRVS